MKIERIIMNELIAHYGYKFRPNTVDEALTKKLVRIVYEIINKHDLQQPVSERKKLTDSQPVSNWIKVSEKLPARKPHRLDFVLIVKDNRVVMEALFNTKLNKFTNLNGSELKHEVTHWQPLPEPPKE